MKKYWFLTITIILLTVTACSHRPIPLAMSYPTTTQNKMQGAYHWEVLADHLASRIKSSIRSSFAGTAIPPFTIRSSEAQQKVPFGKAFYSLLVSKLVGQGMVVLTNAARPTSLSMPYSDSLGYTDTLVVDYDMQVVHHRDRNLFNPWAGTFSGIAATLWLVGHGIDTWTYPDVAVFPLAGLADLYAANNLIFPGETNAEALITTSVTLNQQYVFNSTDIYYINVGDSDHYEHGYKTYQMVNQQ